MHLVKFSLKLCCIRVFHFFVTQEHFLGHTFSFQRYDQFFVGFLDEFVLRQHFFIADCDDPFIVDGGGNIGMSSFFFKHLYPKCHIAVFEPDPKNFEDLKKNLSSFEHIDFYCMALSDAQEVVPFFRDNIHFTGGSISVPPNNTEQLTVKTCQIADVISRDIDYMKLDIEGAEEKVMRHIKESFSYRIKNFFIEYHYNARAPYNHLSFLLEFLEEREYTYTIGSPLLPYGKISAPFTCIIVATHHTP